jgi:hypothetical protein
MEKPEEKYNPVGEAIEFVQNGEIGSPEPEPENCCDKVFGKKDLY